MSTRDKKPADFPEDALFIAFDYGEKHIGVAKGQQISKTATPLTQLTAVSGQPNWDRVGEMITAWQPAALIVGLPLDMNDEALWTTRRATKFANRLNARFRLPAILWDERLTSRDAESRYRELGSRKRAENVSMHSIAAVLILEDWLNS